MGLWKGDDIPNGGLFGHQHNEPVKSQGNAAVGRGAKVKGFQKKTELNSFPKSGTLKRPRALPFFPFRMYTVSLSYGDGAGSGLWAIAAVITL